MFGRNSHSTRTIVASVLQTLKRHIQESKEAATTMNTTDLLPPAAVRGMISLDRSLFAKTVSVPCVLVEQSLLQRALKLVKSLVLKMEQLKPVQDIAGATEDERARETVAENGTKADDKGASIAKEGETKVTSRKKILLNPKVTPAVFGELPPVVRTGLTELGVTELTHTEVALDYRNWKCEEVLSAVLPADQEGSTSYSRVGHIVHLNLREHLIAYRYLIGTVLTDKLKGVTLVVNKTDSIGNEFRNFNMEFLAGDESAGTVATVKENNCSFEFDFAQVFWNSRLSTEHGRLVERLPRNGVLYDVFAGVGPFAVPAARSRRCNVLANDLNPASYQWLCRNVTLNRVADRVATHNLDGRVFLRTVVRADVTKRWREYAVAKSKFGREDEDVSVTCPDLSVVMNLPALAVDFLDALVGLLAGNGNPTEPMIEEKVLEKPIAVHCYTFARLEDFAVSVPLRVESVLGCELDRSTVETFHVRSVSPNKEMIRISFLLPTHVLFRTADVQPGCESQIERGEPLSKRMCVESVLSESDK